MNDSELNPPPQADLADRVAALQRQVTVLLLALLVVSASLAAYLLYEDIIFHKDAANIRPQATAIIRTFNTERASVTPQAITNFLTQLVAYGQKNPDFAQQVLKKPAPAAGTQPKPAPAAPATPTATKK